LVVVGFFFMDGHAVDREQSDIDWIPVICCRTKTDRLKRRVL
jgi:hypothetical protein